MSGQRLNITLDGEHAAKLATLAAWAPVNEGTLARRPGTRRPGVRVAASSPGIGATAQTSAASVKATDPMGKVVR